MTGGKWTTLHGSSARSGAHGRKIACAGTGALEGDRRCAGQAGNVEDACACELFYGPRRLLGIAAEHEAAPMVARLLARELGRDEAWARQQRSLFDEIAAADAAAFA